MFICVAQYDLRLDWKLTYSTPLGLYIFKTKDPRYRKLAYTVPELLAKTAFITAREANVEVVVQPGEHYIIIPCTFQPGQQVKYWLSAYAENALECRFLPFPHQSFLEGGWNGPNAGGCHNHASWMNNPKYLITPLEQVSGSVHIAISLRQKLDKPHYIGMYHGKYEGKVGTYMMNKCEPCKNAKQITAETDVPANEFPYFFIPHTFDPNQFANYEIVVHSHIKVNVQSI